jgi:integrase
VIVRLKYLVEDRDRHGNVRYYVRKRGMPKIRLRGMPGTPEFMAAYQAALSGDTETAGEPNRRQPYQHNPVGSFGHTCLAYYASPKFSFLDEKTQHWRRACLDKVCEQIGSKPIALMQSKHIRALRDQLAKATPAAAHQRLRALKALFTWAVKEEMVPSNPTLNIERIGPPSKRHHSWTVGEIKQYEHRHPIGSKARLAMALILFTACRREDVVRFGPQHIKDGWLHYTQAKNEHRNPNEVDIEVVPELARIIAATPSRHLTFLVDTRGKPYSEWNFNRVMRKWCNESGLPEHCVPHGLRYAITTALADKQATTQEIMAITGHRSLAEVERYTKAANKRLLAASGMAKVVAFKE